MTVPSIKRRNQDN